MIIAGTPRPCDTNCPPYCAVGIAGWRTAEQNWIRAATQWTHIQWKLGVTQKPRMFTSTLVACFSILSWLEMTFRWNTEFTAKTEDLHKMTINGSCFKGKRWLNSTCLLPNKWCVRWLTSQSVVKYTKPFSQKTNIHQPLLIITMSTIRHPQKKKKKKKKIFWALTKWRKLNLKWFKCLKQMN